MTTASSAASAASCARPRAPWAASWSSRPRTAKRIEFRPASATPRPTRSTCCAASSAATARKRARSRRSSWAPSTSSRTRVGRSSSTPRRSCWSLCRRTCRLDSIERTRPTPRQSRGPPLRWGGCSGNSGLLRRRGHRGARRDWRHHLPPAHPLGPEPRAGDARAVGHLPAPQRPVRLRGPDHRLRGRGDGAVPVRDHAARPGPRAGPGTAPLPGLALGGLRPGAARPDVDDAAGRPVPPAGQGRPELLRNRAGDRRRAVHHVPLSLRAHLDPAPGRRDRRHLPESQAHRRAVSSLNIGGSQLDASWFLLLSAVLFGLGAVGVLVRRNPLVILISIELMLNAANLTLVAFSRQLQDMEGQLFALMSMTVAAAEAVVGLAILVDIFRVRDVEDIDDLSELRG